jgi:hypothetical protein
MFGTALIDTMQVFFLILSLHILAGIFTDIFTPLLG